MKISYHNQECFLGNKLGGYMGKTTVIATGDSFITRPLVGEEGYKGFKDVKDIIGKYDVKFNNLEITIHNQEGYPSTFSGGTWAMAAPELLDDLNKFGFNIYNTANNHSMDYSFGGLLATIKYLKERNIPYAGTGEDMQRASAPGYLQTKNAKIALIGVCSSFHDSDRAGTTGLNGIGRPGLNTMRFTTTYHVEKDYYDTLAEIAEKTNMNASKNYSISNGYAQPLPEGKLNFGGISFQLDDKTEKHTAPNGADMERMKASIKEAKANADYVFVSMHSHQFAGTDTTKPEEFYETFAHQCIDCGADAILGHGPHELRGIEIYNGKPIFYSLGNFVFQTEFVSVQPADAYENAKMPLDTTVEAYMNKRSQNGTKGYIVLENIWRSVMAGFTIEDGKVTEVQLYPVIVNRDNEGNRRGYPTLAENPDEILNYMQELSAPFGTKIQIENGVGIIRL